MLAAMRRALEAEPDATDLPALRRALYLRSARGARWGRTGLPEGLEVVCEHGHALCANPEHLVAIPTRRAA